MLSLNYYNLSYHEILCYNLREGVVLVVSGVTLRKSLSTNTVAVAALEISLGYLKKMMRPFSVLYIICLVY